MSVLLLLAGATIAMGATGVGIGAKGGYDQHRAKKINDNSNTRLENAAHRLEDMREKCNQSITALGEEKLFVLSGSMSKFVDAFSKLKNVDFSDSVGLDELSKIQVGSKDFEELKELSKFSVSLLEGAGTGAVGGAIAAFGAYSAAMTFATASTGTAISTLGGVAATNATLAWFGGGSLAAGGAGMAGGAAVLGGIVAGPAILVMGIIVGAKAGKSLENAKANAFQTNEMCEQFENGSLECIAIRRRSYMFYNLLARLDAYLLPLTYTMENIIKTEGVDYSQFKPESKKVIAAAASAAVSVKAVLDTPILSEAGDLTEESNTVSQKLFKDIESKPAIAV